MDRASLSQLNLPSIQEAQKRITPYIHRTPVLCCETINRIVHASVYFKCENLQKAGAFKSRGACNAVFSLSQESARNGVVTHSSGNHGQALARAAKLRGIPAYIVMPKDCLKNKKEAVCEYGGTLILCEPTLAAREKESGKVQEETKATLVHPFDQIEVIAGQGTAAVELIEEVSVLDLVLTPVGGGGLLSGTAVAIKSISPKTKVLGAEPKVAPDAFLSLQQGSIVPAFTAETIADGLRTSLGSLTFPIIQKHVDQILLVSEESIIAAMRLVWERMKIIIEPSAAVTVAALLSNKSMFSGKRVGLILSGGNADLDTLRW